MGIVGGPGGAPFGLWPTLYSSVKKAKLTAARAATVT